MTVDDLNYMISILRDDADAACWNLGYMRAILDNPVVGGKLRDSYSGFAMEVATAAVKRSLVLYCARAWDNGKDAISLQNVTKKVAVEDDPQYEQFMVDFAKAAADENHHPLRIFRSEWLAHRIIESNDRKRLERLKPVGEFTMSNLVKLSEQTILLVGDLGYIADCRAIPFRSRIDRAEGYCREFWRVLPVLRDVEK